MPKLFTNKRYLTEANRSRVFPLLFDLVFIKNPELCNLYKIVDQIDECDFCVLPLDYGFMVKNEANELSKFVKEASIADKKIWFYSAGDYGFTNYIPNSYTFRLGGFDSLMDETNMIMPSFISDPYDTFLRTKFQPLKKEVNPSIGFVGHAQTGWIKWTKELSFYMNYRIKRLLFIIHADKQRFYPSSIIRAKLLNEFNQNKNINTDFIFRTKYRAGVKNHEDRKKSSIEFYLNMFNNPYVFCMRGTGNFSVRFYETLAMGRIPVLIDTDCRLPLDNQIIWKNHCVRIQKKSKLSISEQLLIFHKSISEDEFIKFQIRNRNLWLNKLQRKTYFESIIPYF